MKQLLSFLNIEFLINNNAFKNWRMIIFLSVLALIMIGSGHSTDRKIFQIAQLNTEIKILKTQFAEGKKELVELTKESAVIKRLEGTGLKPSKTPPIKIVIRKE